MAGFCAGMSSCKSTTMYAGSLTVRGVHVYWRTQRVPSPSLAPRSPFPISAVPPRMEECRFESGLHGIASDGSLMADKRTAGTTI